MKKSGRIIIPRDALVQPHEMNVAIILSRAGNDVEFIPARNIPTPDIKLITKKHKIIKLF